MLNPDYFVTVTITVPATVRTPDNGGYPKADLLTPLPRHAVRPDATVADYDAWDALPDEVRALAYRVLALEGTR